MEFEAGLIMAGFRDSCFCNSLGKCSHLHGSDLQVIGQVANTEPLLSRMRQCLVRGLEKGVSNNATVQILV